MTNQSTLLFLVGDVLTSHKNGREHEFLASINDWDIVELLKVAEIPYAEPEPKLREEKNTPPAVTPVLHAEPQQQLHEEKAPKEQTNTVFQTVTIFLGTY